MTDNPLNLTIDDTVTDEWHERDRNSLILYVKDEDGGFGDSIVEWWDEDYVQAIEDGFLEPRRLHESAFEYALERGLLNPANRVARGETPATGWVIVHEELGAYMTSRAQTSHLVEPVWSSEATAADFEKGAVTFSDEQTAREYFEEDVDGEELADNEEFLSRLEFHEVVLDVTPEGHARPRRASAVQLSLIGIEPASPAPTA